MPSEFELIKKNKAGDTKTAATLRYDGMRGLAKGKLATLEMSPPSRGNREDEASQRHNERDRAHRDDGLPSRRLSTQNTTTMSPNAQAGRNNYITNNFYNGPPSPDPFPQYVQNPALQHYQQGRNNTGTTHPTESTAHDPHTCEVHPECLKMQLEEVRKAKTVYLGGSSRATQSVTPSHSLSHNGGTPRALTHSRSQSTSTVVSANNRYMPDPRQSQHSVMEYTPAIHQNQQKTMEETAVDNLARVYAPNGFDDMKIRPDRDFDMLDCKLLMLLDIKHDADYPRALQEEFFKASGRLSTREHSMLEYCDERLFETKMLAIQADFFKETGRMVELKVLKWKLR